MAGAKQILGTIGKVALNVGGSIADGLGFKITDALKSAGVIKDPAQEISTLNALRQIENDVAAQETQQLQAINETMRVEAQSSHWLVWCWRPIVGLTLAGMIVNNYILLPYFAGFGLQPIAIPDKTWEVMLAVVGVASLSRGAEKVMTAWKGKK